MATAERPIVARQLLTAMRHQARSMEIAELRSPTATRGVVGFDIAGAEAGYPPTRHLDAFEYLQRENAHFTIHAGEAFGLPSIWQAIQWCGADRLGHGVRIIDDITFDEARAGRQGRARPVGGVRAGPADPAGDVPELQPADRCGRLDRAAPDRAARKLQVPGHRQHRQPPDERYFDEPRTRLLAEAFDYGLADFRWFAINAMKSAFIPFDERLAIIDDVIKPWYANALKSRPVDRAPSGAGASSAMTAKQIRFVELSGTTMAALLADDLAEPSREAGVELGELFVNDQSKWLWNYRIKQVEDEPEAARVDRPRRCLRTRGRGDRPRRVSRSARRERHGRGRVHGRPAVPAAGIREVDPDLADRASRGGARSTGGPCVDQSHQCRVARDHRRLRIPGGRRAVGRGRRPGAPLRTVRLTLQSACPRRRAFGLIT